MIPNTTRPVFDCFLKNLTISRTGRMSFSCISATSHAMVKTPERETRNAIQSRESTALPHLDGEGIVFDIAPYPF